VWVVKLGGSLASDPPVLRRWIEILAEAGAGKVVIVPGGGPFAEQVRALQGSLGCSDAAAHRMAILAMEQFGLLLADLAPGLATAHTERRIREILDGGGVAVWVPAAMTLGSAEITESWEVTSDSLAAWLARRLQAQALVLVKSCALPEGDTTPEELQRLGIADAAFPGFMRGAGFPLLALHKDRHPVLRWMLQARPAPR
jgi:aspartokinase-like uncharacterized kinase